MLYRYKNIKCTNKAYFQKSMKTKSYDILACNKTYHTFLLTSFDFNAFLRNLFICIFDDFLSV